MVQVNNFREFFEIHSKSFRCFGVIPIFKRAEGPPKLNVLMLGIIVAFLMVYWTGVVFAFLIEKHMNDKISIISNWIQMLGNSLALTTTLGATALKYVEFDNIIAQFHKIDDNLMAIGHSINYTKHLRRSKCIFFAYLGAFGGFMAYDFYITIDKYQMTSVWYWVVSVTPLAIYSVGIYHAMFMIYWIKCRCSLMNKVLKQIRLTGGRTGTPDKFRFLANTIESQLPMGCLLVQPREKLMSARPLKMNGGNLEKGQQILRQRSKDELQLDMNILSQLFLIMNDLCKLARKIDEYYGLFLLTSIGALFAITSIQVYYCYVTAITFNEQLKYSVWTLMVSVNMVTINLSLVVGLSTVCENVSNEATKILQNFSALQIKKDMVSRRGRPESYRSLIINSSWVSLTAYSVRVVHLGAPYDQLHEVLGLWILHHRLQHALWLHDGVGHILGHLHPVLRTQWRQECCAIGAVQW